MGHLNNKHVWVIKILIITPNNMSILFMAISAHSERLECRSLSAILNLTKQIIYKKLKIKMLFLNTREDYTAEELFKIKQLRQLVESKIIPLIVFFYYLIKFTISLTESNELQVGVDEIFLTKFLHYTHWDTFKAYQAIHAYYDFKLKHPTWMSQHPVDYYSKVFYATHCRFIMPQTDRNGRVLVIFKTVDAFQQFPDYLQHLIEMDDLIFESLLMLPRVQQNGITVICDLQG